MGWKQNLVRVTGDSMQLNLTNQNKCTNPTVEQIEPGSVYLYKTSWLFLRNEVHCNIKMGEVYY